MSWSDPTGTKESQGDLDQRDRKAEHIRLALQDRMQLEANFFEEWAFVHDALPEFDRRHIDISTDFLAKRLSAPLLISCMTGGTELAARINTNLAIAAQSRGIALGVGSQRKAIEDPSQAPSFRVREVAPDIPLLANLGAVQLNYGYGLDECEEAVEMIGADALVLHLNPLQEAIQPEGQCNFSGLMPKIAMVAERLSVPVIVKEIGCGISADVARRLKDCGIQTIDVAGLGGTSWSRIEGRRAGDMNLGDLFADWGVPTPDAIRALKEVGGLEIIGSGGVRTGVDVAKAIALGASLVGMAQRFLEAAMESADEVVSVIDRTVQELTISMFCAGARSLDELGQVPLRSRKAR